MCGGLCCSGDVISCTEQFVLSGQTHGILGLFFPERHCWRYFFSAVIFPVGS